MLVIIIIIIVIIVIITIIIALAISSFFIANIIVPTPLTIYINYTLFLPLIITIGTFSI